MSESILITIKLFFLLGFTLHNLEEAFWLPGWLKKVKHYQEPVNKKQIIYTVSIITFLGYIITITDIFIAQTGSIQNYLFLGFICLIGLNTVFWHLVATIILKRYTPGLITGLSFNLPLSYFIITNYLREGISINMPILVCITVLFLVLLLLKYLLVFNRAH